MTKNWINKNTNYILVGTKSKRLRFSLEEWNSRVKYIEKILFEAGIEQIGSKWIDNCFYIKTKGTGKIIKEYSIAPGIWEAGYWVWFKMTERLNMFKELIDSP